VWVTVEKDANKIIIGVHDTGVGISAEKRDKLFERFERGDDAYSRQQEGTGIGLNLTKRLVQINSGNIWIESEVGCGSHFYISLPTATLEATRESITQRNEQNSTMRLDGLSGIVVDDNDTTGELLKLIIEGAGASVKIYNSAVALMQDVSFTKHPDFIMTDLSMPEVSGLELIRWIRQGEKFPKELPVIVLSACAYEEDRDNAADAGASFFLPKPFRPSEILTVIRSLTISATMKRQRNIKIAG
jgi:CheY-like chemotaxis protein